MRQKAREKKKKQCILTIYNNIDIFDSNSQHDILLYTDKSYDNINQYTRRLWKL